MPSSESYVTVVIPAFNAGRTLADAADSVLGQSHQSLQLIIVDDGSSDQTAAVARRYGDDRASLVSVEHGGANRARNLGLARARGKYVAFLDADDYWLPGRLSRQLPLLETNPRIEVVGHLMRYQSIDSDRVLGISGEAIDESKMHRIREGRLVPFPLSSALFRVASVRAAGGFDEQLPAAQELDLYARVAHIGNFVTVPEVLGVYRLHGDSISAKRFSTQRKMARFVRARLLARSQGQDLTLRDFESDYRPTFGQRYDDLVHELYRNCALTVSQQKWLRAIFYGVGALILGPRYSVKRIVTQRWRRDHR
jgi:glycosyltransferase involved in cell wall biosynthesis